jgi:hypothetical protein
MAGPEPCVTALRMTAIGANNCHRLSHFRPLVLGLIGLLRHLQPVLGDLEPAFLVKRVSCPLGLLPTLIGVSSKLVRPSKTSLATSHLFGSSQTAIRLAE